jgi:hypothetical protein
MLDPCPNCGSRDVRVSSQMSLGEKLRSVFGRFPVRCRRCSSRFESTIWKPSMAKYAKCPRCYRTELSCWNVEKYEVPAAIRLKLNLGASPYRCEHCRCNFASFKPCHERFSWRKLRERTVKALPPAQAGRAVEDDAGDSVTAAGQPAG